MFETDNAQSGTVIKVIGVGGAGGNAVNHMAASGVRGVEFICANTDAQALANATSSKIQLGESGLGAGSNPDVGRENAIRERSRIADALRGAHMVFVTAGMGGGTGTGAAPVVAEVAKELGILTVGVVSRPFDFEGSRRRRVADEGIANLSRSVDSLIIVLNDRLEEVLGDDVTQKEAFRAADDVLRNAVAGIAEIINVPGDVNVDFQDVRTVMKEMGTAMMGTATATGSDRAVRAAQEAIACPLLDGTNLAGARGLLVNISAAQDTLKMKETREVMNLIRALASEEAIIKFGTVYDESLGEAMRITVVATGLSLPGADVPANGQAQQSGSAQIPTGLIRESQFGNTGPTAGRPAPADAVPETPSFLRVRAPATPAAPAAPAATPMVRPSQQDSQVRTTTNQDFGRTGVPPFMRHSNTQK